MSSPVTIALHPHLSHAQKSVIEDVLSSQDRIHGFAGAGKTTTLTVIRSAAETQGYQVEGFAPTSRAARQLNEAEVQAGTLQGFLARAADLDAAGQKRFYFVDESSLASTNQMRDFLARITATFGALKTKSFDGSVISLPSTSRMKSTTPSKGAALFLVLLFSSAEVACESKIVR